MSYSAREIRAFVIEEFREAQELVVRRLHDRRRIKYELRAVSQRLTMNPGLVGCATPSGKFVRRHGVDLEFDTKSWLKVRPADPRIWCECGRIFHNENQKNAHRWHCLMKKTA